MKIVKNFEVESFTIDPNDEKVEHNPFIRMSSGEGCGLPGCHCSDGYWISISDGKKGMKVTFSSEDEYKKFILLH